MARRVAARLAYATGRFSELARIEPTAAVVCCKPRASRFRGSLARPPLTLRVPQSTYDGRGASPVQQPNRQGEASMTTTLTPTNTGPRVTLATYMTEAGEERALIGERVDGVPRVIDAPAEGQQDGGETYVVEPQIEESRAVLDALVADYLEKAAKLGYPPMHGWF